MRSVIGMNLEHCDIQEGSVLRPGSVIHVRDVSDISSFVWDPGANKDYEAAKEFIREIVTEGKP